MRYKLLLLFIVPISLFTASATPANKTPSFNTSSFTSTLTHKELEWLNKKKPLRYVYDPDWAPFEWKNDIKHHTGIIADILRIIEYKTGITFTAINTETWEKSIKLVKDRKVDMISAITINSDRKKYLHFTSSDIYSYPAVFVTRFTDKSIYLDINKDFKNKKIGIVKSSGLVLILKKAIQI